MSHTCPRPECEYRHDAATSQCFGCGAWIGPEGERENVKAKLVVSQEDWQVLALPPDMATPEGYEEVEFEPDDKAYCPTSPIKMGLNGHEAPVACGEVLEDCCGG